MNPNSTMLCLNNRSSVGQESYWPRQTDKRVRLFGVDGDRLQIMCFADKKSAR